MPESDKKQKIFLNYLYAEYSIPNTLEYKSAIRNTGIPPDLWYRKSRNLAYNNTGIFGIDK